MTPVRRADGRPSNPYVGMRPYYRDDHNLFYGRESEAREVATMWQATGLSVLYGASGVGKTSLLHAGVLPRLDPERADALPVGRVSPGRVLHAAQPGNPYVLALLASWAPDVPLSGFAGMTISDFLSLRPEKVDRYGDPVLVLAAVDQAEEIFQGPTFRENERAEFLDQLAAAMRTHEGLHLLLALREEYLYAVLPHEQVLGQGTRSRLHLKPLSREAALQAVVNPLEGTGRSFVSGAAELLVSDLSTVLFTNDDGVETTLSLDSVEPVQLQVVCSALWTSLPPEVVQITPDHARAYADVDRFLVRFCKTVIDEVAEEHRVLAGEILLWLRNTFITEHGTRSTAYEGLRETAGMPNSIARALEDRHVLRAEHRLGIRWYELQHDRLIGPIKQHETPTVYLREARDALERESWLTARALAGEAIRVASDQGSWIHAEATEIYGAVAAAQGDVEAAHAHFDKALEMFAVRQQFGGVARVLTADGKLLLAQGKVEAAIERLKTVQAWESNNVQAKLALGEALWAAGQPGAALSHLNGALALSDQPPVAALALRGEILADMGQAEAALRDLDRTAVRRNQQPGTLAARALALALVRRFDAAEQEILDATAPGSANGPVLHRAARVYALLGRSGISHDYVTQALQATEPGLPSHLREQALLLAREPA
ncbi:hypothetical protein GCM10009555_007010 [Acrocarpospora macrocephala]|uniref:Novel STAND NTPase 1 domain-containing protein n=1 Tax=Acrocarpospora macrocephala TaxID=150177 RepID=A0A5M3WZ47_9ACTN|nr:tetratricopeptide repeat protein [Acrocarpospora macrocephala]GES13169.1 hypothetical protein Amac_067660 [Acrocarpospora macrocephala]